MDVRKIKSPERGYIREMGSGRSLRRTYVIEKQIDGDASTSPPAAATRTTPRPSTSASRRTRAATLRPETFPRTRST